MKSVKIFSLFCKLTTLLSLLLFVSGAALADTYRMFLKEGTNILYTGSFNYTVGDANETITRSVKLFDGTTFFDTIIDGIAVIEINHIGIDDGAGTITPDDDNFHSDISRVRSFSGSGSLVNMSDDGTWTNNTGQSGTYYIFNTANDATIPIASTFYLMLAGIGSAFLLRRKKSHSIK